MTEPKLTMVSPKRNLESSLVSQIKAWALIPAFPLQRKFPAMFPISCFMPVLVGVK